MAGTYIGVTDDAGIARKVTKVLPLRDGGFSLVAPLHGDGDVHFVYYEEHVRKALQPRSIERRETSESKGAGRVKLSYHGDGFVQFSDADGTNPITSGIDEATGKPKGLHVFSDPIDSDAPYARCLLQAWGLSDFEAITRRHKKKEAIIFKAPSCEFRDCDERTAGGFQVLFFILRKDGSLGSPDFGTVFPHATPVNHLDPGAGFTFERLVAVPLRAESPSFLGITCLRTKQPNPSVPSGYVLHSPGGPISPLVPWIQGRMWAMHPSNLVVDVKLSRDYVPKVRDVKDQRNSPVVITEIPRPRQRLI